MRVIRILSLLILLNRYKLIRPKNGDPQLYDIMADPGETQNIFANKPRVVATLSTWLKDWQVSVEQSLTGAKDY